MANFVDIHTHDRDRVSDGPRLVCLEPRDAVSATGTDDRFCTGIHPWKAGLPESVNDFEMVSTAARSGRLHAVGETGLDRSRHKTEFDAQVGFFRMHARLAEETRLPLVIHSVRTNSDILAEHARLRPSSRWILHACSANPDELGRILSKGLGVSFGPRELARVDAPERLRAAFGPGFFLETDDSGESIESVYALAARLTGMGIGEIADRTRKNWDALFGP